MSKGRSLRRLWRSPFVLAAAAVFFAAGLTVVGSTFAFFSTETDNNTSTLANGWIGLATGLTAAPSGTDASLAWTPGTHGPVTGQQVNWLDNNTSSTCPSTGYSLLATLASATTSSYTASNPTTTTLTDQVGPSTTLKTALNQTATLNGTITSGALTITVTNHTGFPNTNNYPIQIDGEVMEVTGGAGTNTWTVTRGYDSTTAASHTSGAQVDYNVVVLNSFTNYPTNNGFTIQVESEDMTVFANANLTTGYWVDRGVFGTTIPASHAANVAINQVSIPVASHTGFPSSGTYTILVDSEQMTVTSGAGTNSWIVTRGANSTTIAAHSSGATVYQPSDPVTGHYYCYQLVSTSATSWTGKALFPSLQMGLVAQSITLANGGGGSSGKVDTGDTITIVFNQAPTGIATGTNKDVCVVDTVNPAIIVLGDTAGCHGSTDANDTGTISGLTMAGGGAMGANAIENCNTSTVALSSATLTITVGGAGTCADGSGTPVTSSGSGTYIPNASIKTAAVTDQSLICTSATYSCKPTTSGTF